MWGGWGTTVWNVSDSVFFRGVGKGHTILTVPSQLELQNVFLSTRFQLTENTSL